MYYKNAQGNYIASFRHDFEDKASIFMYGSIHVQYMPGALKPWQENEKLRKNQKGNYEN